jgi:hypothetical protein
MMGSDSPHRFRKTVAGACMMAAPVLGLIGFIVSPGLKDSEAALLGAVSADRDEWFTGQMLVLLSLVALVPAVLGLMHMLREKQVALGHTGGALALLGTMAAIGSTAIGFVVWQMAGSTATAEMVALMERVNDTAGTAIPFYVAVFALPLGLVALAWGLMRAEAVHPAMAACLALGAVIAAIGFGAAETWMLVAGYVVLLFGLGGIGQIVLAETEEDWEHTPRFRGFRPAAGAS